MRMQNQEMPYFQRKLHTLFNPTHRNTKAIFVYSIILVFFYILSNPLSSEINDVKPPKPNESIYIHPFPRDNPNYRYPQTFEQLNNTAKSLLQQRFIIRVQASFEMPETCVFNCSSIPEFSFKMHNGMECDSRKSCSFTGLASFHHKPNRYVYMQKKAKVSCHDSGRMAVCRFPFKHDCDYHGWREWIVHFEQSKQPNFTKRFFSVQYLPGRPFMINNIFETDEQPSHYKVVSYFQPAILHPDRCNQMYCFYEHADGSIEKHDAIPGDMSFVYCPKPKRSVRGMNIGPARNASQTLLRLSYDHKIFSNPFEIIIDKPMDSFLPKVFMTICTIVRREGKYLKEWVAYHFMMGYDRIILYDNNEPGYIDTEMDQLIRAYPDRIIRYWWPFTHAQTEQCTDCILRFGATTKWMTNIDVDEFLVPSPPHENVRSLLLTKYRNDTILQAGWVVFGPCVAEEPSKKMLVMEQCRSVYGQYYPLFKPTFKPAFIAGMQAIGPHFPRLKTDIGRRLRSEYHLVNNDLRTYHYRYRTFPEFVERRMGSAADRIVVYDMKRLKKDWYQAIFRSAPYPDAKNHILRLIPRLRQEIKEVTAHLYRL